MLDHTYVALFAQMLPFKRKRLIDGVWTELTPCKAREKSDGDYWCGVMCKTTKEEIDKEKN